MNINIVFGKSRSYDKKKIDVGIGIDDLKPFLCSTPDGFLLSLTVKPGAHADRLFIDPLGNPTLSIRVKAMENQANIRICEFLGKVFSCPKSDVLILSGHKSRKKRILIKV